METMNYINMAATLFSILINIAAFGVFFAMDKRSDKKDFLDLERWR